MHHAIFVIVDRGKGQQVMDLARDAGSRRHHHQCPRFRHSEHSKLLNMETSLKEVVLSSPSTVRRRVSFWLYGTAGSTNQATVSFLCSRSWKRMGSDEMRVRKRTSIIVGTARIAA